MLPQARLTYAKARAEQGTYGKANGGQNCGVQRKDEQDNREQDVVNLV
jgi:hypothetical protein